MVRVFIFSLLALLLSMSKPIAQTQESAWRVVNPSPTDLVPDYAGEENPFPWEPVPVVEVETNEFVDQEALALAEKRALLLEALRSVISDQNPYVVDFEDLKPRGYLAGIDGVRIIMGQNWQKEGDRLMANVHGIQSILEKLEMLKDLDPKAAQDLKDKIFKIMPQTSRIELLITEINTKYVRLRDSYGRTYKLSTEDDF